MIETLYQKGYVLAVRLVQESDVPGTGNPGSGVPGGGNPVKCNPETGQVCVPGNLPGSQPGGPDLADVIANVINWGLTMAGGVAVLMFVAGGFMYITAAGDEKRIERGKSIVRSAITGIIIILISAIIVNTLNYALFRGAGLGSS